MCTPTAEEINARVPLVQWFLNPKTDKACSAEDGRDCQSVLATERERGCVMEWMWEWRRGQWLKEEEEEEEERSSAGRMTDRGEWSSGECSPCRAITSCLGWSRWMWKPSRGGPRSVDGLTICRCRDC